MNRSDGNGFAVAAFWRVIIRLPPIVATLRTWTFAISRRWSYSACKPAVCHAGQLGDLALQELAELREAQAGADGEASRRSSR